MTPRALLFASLVCRAVGAHARSAAAAAAGCDAPFSVSPTGAFTDACGRARLFRGLNLVSKSPPYLPPRADVPGGSSLSPTDAALWASLGFNAVRLGVLWAGVAPTPGAVNATLLRGLAELAAAAFSEAGIFTLLDAHQDGLSPRFCDDGAPAWWAARWATGGADPARGFPAPLAAPYAFNESTGLPLGGKCGTDVANWAEYYATYAVGAGFQNLYSDAAARADFAAFWTAVVAATAGVDSILGYEIINEPWAGDALADPLLLVPGVADAVNLDPFYAAMAAALRAAEAAAGTAPRILFLEPVTWDNAFPAGFNATAAAAPWAAERGRTALSHHFYALPDVFGAAANIAARAADAVRLGAAAMLTEFDIGLVNPVVSPYTRLDLRATLDAADAHAQGWLGWDASALYQGDATGATLVTAAVRELARPAPLAIAGRDGEWAFDARDEARPVFSLNYTQDTAVAARAPTRIFVSTGLWFTGGALNVTVESVPAGAAVWHVEALAGQVVAGPVGNATRSSRAAFAYAVVVVDAAAGAVASALVRVRVALAGA